jgi:hypothetical protein
MWTLQTDKPTKPSCPSSVQIGFASHTISTTIRIGAHSKIRVWIRMAIRLWEQIPVRFSAQAYCTQFGFFGNCIFAILFRKMLFLPCLGTKSYGDTGKKSYVYSYSKSYGYSYSKSYFGVCELTLYFLVSYRDSDLHPICQKSYRDLYSGSYSHPISHTNLK